MLVLNRTEERPPDLARYFAEKSSLGELGRVPLEWPDLIVLPWPTRADFDRAAIRRTLAWAPRPRALFDD